MKKLYYERTFCTIEKVKMIVLLLALFMGNLLAQSQNYLILDGINSPGESFCATEYDGVVAYAAVNIGNNRFIVTESDADGNYTVILEVENVDSIFFNISVNNALYNYYYIDYHTWNWDDAINGPDYPLYFFPSEIPLTPFPEPYIWKRGEEEITLWVPDMSSGNWIHYDFMWSTGNTNCYCPVTNPGTYTVNVSDKAGCASETYSVQVRDHLELYRATIDLATNLNKTTWQVTEEQAEYISEVKVYRDGLLVGTTPYEQGYYLDAIGSNNAARNYRIVGVSVEGEDCPIESYEKGTIHTTYYQDVNGNLNMTWNIPYVEEGAQGALTYFQICKYDPNTGEISVVDQVNASITDYTCGVNQFDGGQAVIAAVFNDGKGIEELSFSNLSEDILSIGENGENAFRIYPNPAKDRVTIEGTGVLTVTNALGQTILNKDIDGKATIDLPQGMYFVKLGDKTQKIVVK
jgi:hypothetical protein